MMNKFIADFRFLLHFSFLQPLAAATAGGGVEHETFNFYAFWRAKWKTLIFMPRSMESRDHKPSGKKLRRSASDKNHSIYRFHSFLLSRSGSLERRQIDYNLALSNATN
jgi:hypothetical protein